MKKKDINKSLNEMKKFIISEMKRESANWDKYEGYDEEKVFKSEYIKISIIKNVGKLTKFFVSFNNNVRELHSLKYIGISNIRFYFLLRNVIRLSNRNAEIKRKIGVSYAWEKFLSRNKDLNRDRKLDDILK